MDLDAVDLGEFMQDVGKSGITVMIKIDDQRLREGGKPWTALISGPPLGSVTTVRWDFRTLGECLKAIEEKLRGLPGEWEWLDLYC